MHIFSFEWVHAYVNSHACMHTIAIAMYIASYVPECESKATPILKRACVIFKLHSTFSSIFLDNNNCSVEPSTYITKEIYRLMIVHIKFATEYNPHDIFYLQAVYSTIAAVILDLAVRLPQFKCFDLYIVSP